MTSPWFRLQCDYYLDRDLRRAGPEARVCWPAVLCVVKQGRGYASDAELDPFVLADIIGGSEEMWSTAVERLKAVGLLVQEEKGWTARSWQRFQPDSRPNSRSRNVPGTPDLSQGHPGTPGDTPGTPVARTMDHVPEQENNPPTPRKRGASRRATHDESPEALEVYAFWKALQAERGTIRTGKAFPAAWQVQARINEFGVPTVKAVVEWAHKADHKLAANLREGDYLTDTLFRPGNFPKYEGPALAWKAGTPTQDKEAWLKDWRETLDTFDSACRLNGFTASREGFLAFLGAHRRAALPVPESVLDLVDRRIARSA
jgi:hypothetical protein